MEKEEAIKLLKKYIGKHIRNLPFVDGEVNEYILLASIDLCVEEEKYEMAALFKKFIDIGFYDNPDSQYSKDIYDFLKKAENLDNQINHNNIDEEGFMKDNNDKEYIEAKIKELESKLILNEKCINKIKTKVIRNPFDDNKWKPRFEYYRDKALQNYYDENIELNEELNKLLKKFKK